MKYKVTITKTADGMQDYMQVIAEDQFSTNIVLIGEFEVNDARVILKPKGKLINNPFHVPPTHPRPRVCLKCGKTMGTNHGDICRSRAPRA